MKKDISHFENLEKFVEFSYGNFGNSLQIYERPFSLGSPLGYCYKYTGNGVTIYNVVHSPIGKDHTDRRIVAHEFGHITLGHLDGIHEDLDGRVLWTIQNNRQDLIDGINKELGIDYADKLLNRVIDDPSLNHSLHNIAMDFEVNQQILSTEDIEEMETDITEVMVEKNPFYQKLKSAGNSIDLDKIDQDPNLTQEEKDNLKKVKDEINKQIASSKVKLMLPERYHLKDGSPFPTDLTYPEYLILIIKNLDQFVKMLVSLKNGGNGDTSDVTDQDLQDALGDGGMQSLDDLMNSAGMGQGQGNSGNKYKGIREDPNSNQPGGAMDHGTESRDEADDKREKGQIQSNGGDGCGSSGGANGYIDANDGPKDSVEMAIEEVIRNFKTKVCSFTLKKDNLYLYNRGINRTIMAPTYHMKARHTTNPKIVFLIDVSGSMNTDLVKRILRSIATKMKNIRKGLKYDIIAWSTRLCSHITDIDPKKPVPHISVGGGTRMAKGIEYFKSKYGEDSVMVLISDFEDYLDEWEQVTDEMSSYDLYAFNYGWSKCERTFKNLKVRNFQNEQ